MTALSESLRAVNATLEVLSKALQGELYGDSWLPHIKRLIGASKSQGSSPQGCFDFGVSITSLYGGMGSFNDTSYSKATEDLKAGLYDAARDLLRAAWAAKGEPTVQVDRSDVLRVGDSVRLIQGEIIFMRSNGELTPAPKSPLTYRIMEVCPLDIDGMPVYSIQADSHCRVARHNALTKT